MYFTISKAFLKGFNFEIIIQYTEINSTSSTKNDDSRNS